MPEQSKRTNTAKALIEEWKIPAVQGRYHHEGTWFQVLDQFPGALFDPKGYLLFETKADYEGAKGLSHGKKLNVHAGIDQVAGYVPFGEWLTDQGTAVLSALVARIAEGRVTPGDPTTYFSYKALHDHLRLPLKGTFGESLRRQGLGALAYWTRFNGFPAITGLVVDSTSMEPGAGYFDLFKPLGDKYAWWNSEIAASTSFDWQRASTLKQEAAETPSPADQSPPERIRTEIYRTLRDTALARRVKARCNFECQICGTTIVLPSGSRYAEAHHIKPLGSSHGGIDDESNIICVCPNHHAQLDYGVLRFTEDHLSKASAARISRAFVEYHNSEIFGKDVRRKISRAERQLDSLPTT